MKVSRIGLLWFAVLMSLGTHGIAFAQDAEQSGAHRTADEIPEGMPDPPPDAPPAEAPPVEGTDDRPPHPETPEALEEQAPTAEALGQTVYHWLPGHWVYTGEA
ncbi:MAG: hypothetical protein KJO57_13950, partial [Deltaproteobacteria bacterium]|nr:hypothetical protein [Deltaproteobacteria bacterium]